MGIFWNKTGYHSQQPQNYKQLSSQYFSYKLSYTMCEVKTFKKKMKSWPKKDTNNNKKNPKIMLKNCFFFNIAVTKDCIIQSCWVYPTMWFFILTKFQERKPIFEKPQKLKPCTDFLVTALYMISKAETWSSGQETCTKFTSPPPIS